jgi:S-adenosylmethionine/arginine decarboxylase-like enzyme
MQYDFGTSTLIDLIDCDYGIITSPQKIREYIDQLVCLLKMKKYGDLILKDFGDTDAVKGYTAIQMIETSSITCHFVNAYKFAAIDITSCGKYYPKQAAEFSGDFFNARNMKYEQITRGIKNDTATTADDVNPCE